MNSKTRASAIPTNNIINLLIVLLVFTGLFQSIPRSMANDATDPASVTIENSLLTVTNDS